MRAGGAAAARSAVRAFWTVLLAFAVLFGGAASAAGVQILSPRWGHLTPAASPPAGFRDPMAYDAATRQLVLYDEANGGGVDVHRPRRVQLRLGTARARGARYRYTR